MEFEAVVAASGCLGVLPRVQRIKMSQDYAGRRARVWADEHTVHILIDGRLVRGAPSRRDVGNPHELALRGAVPAGPPPPAAPSSARKGRLEPGDVIEIDRNVDQSGIAQVGGVAVAVGYELANRRVTLRLDGHLLHVVHDGVLAKTLPAPIDADQRASLRGARTVTGELPSPAGGAVRVERKVPAGGIIMVARQRLRIGRTYAGELVTVHVEDTYFRVTLNDAELSLHPRKNQHPVTRFRAKSSGPERAAKASGISLLTHAVSLVDTS